MASSLSLSNEELARVVRMTADALDLIIAEASRRDGRPGEEANARLLERRRKAESRLDVRFALDLAERLGEEALRDAVEEYSPPSARASLDALVELEGGMLPLVQDRMGRLDPAADTTFSDDSFGCALGAVAIIGGMVANQVIGGIAVVIGIVAVASWC